MSNAVKTRWLQKPEEFLAIKNSWNTLAHVHPHALFLSHEWFATVLCWQPALSQWTIWIAEQDNKILGIIPLRIAKTSIRGMPIRQLEYLCVPDAQFLDILAKSEHKRMLLEFFFDDLHHTPFVWDTLHFYPLCQDYVDFVENCSPKLTKSIQQSSKHYYIHVASSWESFYQSRSRRLKKGNNHLRNKLYQAGEIQIEYIEANANEQKIQESFTNLMVLSQHSWKNATQTTFNYEGPKRFITQLYKTALEKNWLSLWFLRFNGKPIAFELQLKAQACIYALRSDFDENYRHLAPGSYLNWKIIENLYTRKNFAYYFMGPGHNSYKERWQNAALPLYYLRMYANTTKGKLLRSINEKLIPHLKHTFSL